MSSPESGKHWVYFKYERILTLCFRCGRIGHDVKHYSDVVVGHETETQYSDWMRAGWHSKGGSSRSRTTSSKGRAATEVGTVAVGKHASVNTPGILESDSLGETNDPDANPTLGTAQGVTSAKDLTTLLLQTADNQDGWDKAKNLNLKCIEKEKGISHDKGVRMIFQSTQDPTNYKMDDCSIVGQAQESKGKAHEVTSLLRQKLERKCKVEATSSVHGPTKGTRPKKKQSLKQIARQVAHHQSQALDTEMLNSDVGVGSKRPSTFELLEAEENRAQKRLFTTPYPLTLLPLIIYWRWLPCSTARSNDCPWMENQTRKEDLCLT